jgi:hypothetical protein
MMLGLVSNGFFCIQMETTDADGASDGSDGFRRVQMEIADARLYLWMAQRAVD